MFQSDPIASTQGGFLSKVFAWMGLALAITASVAYYIFKTPIIFKGLFSNPFLVFGIFIVQLILVIVLSAFVLRLSFPVAITIFLGYSISMGVTLSSIFYLYQIYSIYLAFAVAAAMFGFMALYGYFTKANLSSVGSIARMGLFGLIIGLIINLFLQNSTFDYILTLVGVAVFTLLTAYDVQKIKQIGSTLFAQGQQERKIAIVGALILYLDFVNLFLMMLRLLGRRKD